MQSRPLKNFKSDRKEGWNEPKHFARRAYRSTNSAPLYGGNIDQSDKRGGV